MDQRELDLVRSSFASLAAMPEVAGALFYEHLFFETPAYRAMFKNDMRVQAVKLINMLELIVGNLDRLEEVLPTVRELGVRHVKYGVRHEDYDALKKALLWMFEQALGDEFDPETRAAWARCYDLVADEMKAAARAAIEAGASSGAG